MDFFKTLFKAFKFAASATVGIPIACSASAFIGSLYLIAEATDIVETNVKTSVDGSRKIYHKPFYQAISDSLGTAFGTTWSELGAYAPLAVMKEISKVAGRSDTPRDLVSSTLERVVNDDSFTKENPALRQELAQSLEQMRHHTPEQAAEFANASKAQAMEFPTLMNEKLGRNEIDRIYGELDKNLKQNIPSSLPRKVNSITALDPSPINHSVEPNLRQ